MGGVQVSLLGDDAALRTFTADLKGSFKGKPLPAKVFAAEVFVKTRRKVDREILSGHHAEALIKRGTPPRARPWLR